MVEATDQDEQWRWWMLAILDGTIEVEALQGWVGSSPVWGYG